MDLRHRSRWLSAVVLSVVGCGGAEPDVALEDPGLSNAAAPVALEGARDEAATPALRAALIAAVQASAPDSYAVSRQNGALSLPNDKHGFTSTFRDGAVEVSLAGGEAMQMRAASVGCASAPVALEGAEVEAAGNRVTYRRSAGGAQLSEWYVSGPLGLEQGFTLDSALPCGSATTATDGQDLVVTLDVSGDVAPSQAEAGVVRFTAPSGEVLRYSQLHVEDAAGVTLPSSITIEGGKLALHIADDGATYPIVIDPLVAHEDAVLTPPGVTNDDNLGYALAIDGDTAVLGADRKTSSRGAAYVFVRSGGAWSLQATLIPADAVSYDSFGYDVDISGDTLVASTLGGGGLGGGYHGRVYVYVRTGSVWTLQQQMNHPDPVAYGKMGQAVAVEGDRAVFLCESSASVPTGIAYVYERSGGVWSLDQALVASGNMVFGYKTRSIDLSGDTVAIGSSGTREVYIFEKSLGVWSEQQKLVSPAPDFDPWGYATTDEFGWSVAIEGDSVFVGAPKDGSHSTAAGAAYVYDRTGTTWTNSQVLYGTGIEGVGYFGRSIAVSGSTLVVGSDGNNTQAVQAGGVFVYVKNGATWSEQLLLTASDGLASTWLGIGVAVSQGTALAGAWGDDTYAPNGGKVYTFAVPTGIVATCVGATDGSLCDDGDPCTYGDTCASGVCVGTPEVDQDGDGVCDPIDNCVNYYNPSQLDLNINGFGEACLSACIDVPLDYGSVDDTTISASAPNASFNVTGLSMSASYASLMRFDLSVLPPETLVSSAQLRVSVYKTTGPANVELHRVTGPWAEGVTYNGFGGAYDPAIEGTFVSGTGYKYVDMMPLVQSWLDGSVANEGLLLTQQSGGTRIYSSESTANGGAFAPLLTICYTAPEYP